MHLEEPPRAFEETLLRTVLDLSPPNDYEWIVDYNNGVNPDFADEFHEIWTTYLFEGLDLQVDGHDLWLTGQEFGRSGNLYYVVLQIEFDFRNDATRHLWSGAAEPETNLPSREEMLLAAAKVAKRWSQRSVGPTELLVDEYTGIQPDGSDSTKDRHIVRYYLWVNEDHRNTFGERWKRVQECVTQLFAEEIEAYQQAHSSVSA